MIYFGTDEFWKGLSVVVCWGLVFSTGLLFVFAGSGDRKLFGKRVKIRQSR